MNGKFISAPAALLVIIFFFLPWVTVSCEGAVIGEFSGYELAAGVETSGDNTFVTSDTMESDPILFGIPLTAVITLMLLAVALRTPAFNANASWGIIIAALIGLLIPVFKWLQMQNSNDPGIDVALQPGMWGTLIALLVMGAGGVYDLLRPSPVQVTSRAPQQPPPLPLAPRPSVSRRSATPTPPAAPTIIEGDKFDPNATILEDDYSIAADLSNRTIVDDDFDIDASAASYKTKTPPENDVKHDRFRFPDSAVEFDEPTKKPWELRPETPATPPAENQQPVPPPAKEQPSGSTPKTEVLHLGSEMMAWLVVGSGERKGEQFRLHRDTTIGRDPASDIVIDETAMSGLHARIKLENGRFVIYDQQSTNGLFLYNTERDRWEPKTRAALEDGSRIKLGRTVFYLMTLALNE